MNDAEFEELLTAAAIRAGELDYLADMPSDAELKRINNPSPGFQRRMRAMLRNPRGYVRKLHKPVYLRVLRTAAAIFITFVILLGAAMVVSPTVRAAVIGFVSSWFEDRTEYKTPDGIVGTGWMFGYTPDGFTLSQTMDNQLQVVRVYTNDKSETIMITITTGQGIVDNEHSTFYQSAINGRVADIYEATVVNQNNIIVMYDDSEGVNITLTSSINIDELIRVAEGISK